MNKCRVQSAECGVQNEERGEWPELSPDVSGLRSGHFYVEG